MNTLILAAAVFLAMHFFISGSPLRAGLVAIVGERIYTIAFSLASVALLWWLALSYGAARNDPADALYWSGGVVFVRINAVIQFLAFLLAVPGLLTPNPTSVMQEKVAERPDAVRGMLRITRHPFLWGVALWALGHLLTHGDRAGVVMFGSLLLLALIGAMSIDDKRTRELGASWTSFAAQTSNVPFLAILTRRNSLKLGEIGWMRLAAAVAVYAAAILAHPFVFGISALS